MALQLTTSYSKKLGLPGFSSHGLNVTLVQEITSPDDIDEAVSTTYQRLQDAVDRELQNVGWLPNSDSASSASTEPSSNGYHRNGKNSAVPNGNHHGSQQQPWKCSQKQMNLIQRVAGEQGLRLEDLNLLAEARYSKPVCDLNKLEASGLIDELLDTQRQPAGASNGRNGFVGTNGRNGR